jgi:hypothetical protein
MRNGRLNTSNCRIKLQIMGVLYTHPLQEAQALTTCINKKGVHGTPSYSCKTWCSRTTWALETIAWCSKTTFLLSDARASKKKRKKGQFFF